MKGRPESSEAREHYFTYIRQVTGDDPIAALESQVEEAPAFFSGISEQASLKRYAPGKWSMRETLNHVTDTERAFGFRALWFARGFTVPLPGFDQDLGAAAAKADAVPWAAHIEEFGRVRLATISLFRNLPPEAWMRTGTSNGNLFTVRAIPFIVAGHLTHHIALLRERYL